MAKINFHPGKPLPMYGTSVPELWLQINGETYVVVTIDRHPELLTKEQYDEERECQGHEPGPNESAGITVYCDGSCRAHHFI